MALRVAYLTQHADLIGGGERSLLDLLQWLPADVEPLLVVPARGAMARLARAIGVELAVLPMPPLASLALPRAWLAWRRFWRAQRFDLVHANNMRPFVLAALAGVRPIVLHARVAARDPLDRWALRRAAAIVCNSEATARARFPAAHPKVRVILNGIAPPRLDAPVTRARRLVWLGRWDAIKRPELAVDLFERVAREWDGELVIAGGALPGDPTADRLRARVARSFVRDRIELRPPTRKVGELLASARLCLVTSRHEGFCRVAVEAMALGTPVAAFDVGALPEIVGEGGVLAGDLDALAARMRPLLFDDAAWARTSEQARKRAARFSPERMVQALQALYRELTHGA